ncbi:ATP-binding cassette domain-containing protein [Acidianus brierleyi]|uniref:ABC transporter ATP-binding protein n=2 Tax=Acidianus brierleyi TaxID=41673 RepID=A0A2U9IIM0_9CREN|nr:ABC transporter ATP-binding protein [Acidianus brierleyi]AWR95870.1 ATP-binding cassette domain-containing protein [Acidianus brierleyi]
MSIEVEDLWKIYKNRVEALRGISFSVNSGEVFSLLGPNGAGKTTTVKILSCVLKPTKGKVSVLGFNIPEMCNEVRKIVGIVPQEFQGFSDLTVEDNIKYFSSLYDKKSDIDELIDILDLKKYVKTKFKQLSGGYKRRVAIACALAGDPKIVYLDEPTVGLDPKSRRNLWDIVRDLKRSGITVLLTTHYLDEAEILSDKVAVIYDGRIVRIGTPKELMSEFNKSNLEEAYLALMESLGEQ